MYKHFYSLQSDPFRTNPDPRFLYMMLHTREALAALQYGISSRRGFMVLTGEVGTGKTTILRSTLNTVRSNRTHSSFVFNPRLEVLDFLAFVLNDFGVKYSERNKSHMLIQLNKWLVECFRQGELCVLVVDEAQNLSWEMMEEIRLLTNLETSSEKLLQIVLCGQPELESRLREANLRQLRQRVSLWCRTQSLTPEQTAEYIATRLQIAGGSSQIFPVETIAIIHEGSGGIPRIINLICENCLIFGYVDQTPTISPDLAMAVIKDCDLGGAQEESSLPLGQQALSSCLAASPVLPASASDTDSMPNGTRLGRE